MVNPTSPTTLSVREDGGVIHILWLNAGLSCDGESVALTGATQPSIEEIALGALPGLPTVALHWPLIDFECGPDQGADTFIEWFHKADRGEVGPFVLVVEGSVPNEPASGEGYFTGFGYDHDTGQPITVNEWLDRLAPKAAIVLAVGTCAAYGGIHGMAGNPTGAMGVPDYLGWDWTSRAGVPIVCVPDCPAHPDMAPISLVVSDSAASKKSWSVPTRSFSNSALATGSVNLANGELSSAANLTSALTWSLRKASTPLSRGLEIIRLGVACAATRA